MGAYAAIPEILERLKKSAERILHIEQGVNEWVEVTEKTFYFATYAKKEFDTGDYERKSEMLRALGQNFILRDEKLEITMLPHLLALKNGLEQEPLKSARLEPQLSGSITRENSPLGAAYSHWSGQGESNPYPFVGNEEFYH